MPKFYRVQAKIPYQNHRAPYCNKCTKEKNRSHTHIKRCADARLILRKRKANAKYVTRSIVGNVMRQIFFFFFASLLLSNQFILYSHRIAHTRYVERSMVRERRKKSGKFRTKFCATKLVILVEKNVVAISCVYWLRRNCEIASTHIGRASKNVSKRRMGSKVNAMALVKYTV